MNKNIFHRLIYICISATQFLQILFSIVNILFCIITKSLTVFYLSLDFLLLPFYRFTENGNVFDLIVMFLFVSVSVFLAIGALIESLGITDNEIIKPFKFTALNLFWSVAVTCCNFLFISLLEILPIDIPADMPILSFIRLDILSIYFVSAFLMFLLRFLSNYNYLMERKSSVTVNFKLIEKQSNQFAIIEISVFVLVFLFKYFTFYIDASAFYKLQNICYLVAVWVLIFYYIQTRKILKNHQKTGLEPNPPNRYFKKIFMKQIVSFVLFVLSYFSFYLY